MPEPTAPESVAITVDGQQVEARPGELVIEACERNGVYIPRFCYHPRMNPVGMCRMCLVEVDTGRGPALQPSCMIPVSPDMAVTTDSEPVVKAQEGVLEFLLINHPLDCPVCDKGGECPLQDQTMSHGPGESRLLEEKRHFEKPIPVSDLVLLDRERCILCDRCTRFAKEVAGDPLIHFMDRGNQTQVNTFPDHPFASYFSGNTVQICPVGALTATAYRFKARPWDLETVESTCTTCSVGCRITIDTSRNRVLRYNGVDVDEVNWGWLCDKGRFGFESIQSDARLGEPLVRGAGGELAPARWAQALDAAAAAIREGLDRSGPGGVAVLGGAHLTNESAYAWAKLAKGVIGTDHVDAQLGDGLPAEVALALPPATIDDACRRGGTVVLLGPDLKEELPVLFLRLRHAVVEDRVRLIELAPAGTSLSPLAAASLRYAPGEGPRLVEALLAGGAAPEGVDARAWAAAVEGLAQEDLTVIAGRASLAESAAHTVDACLALHRARPGTRFLPALRRGNVRGALEMGLAPGLLPGRVALAEGRGWYGDAWGSAPAERGHDAAEILAAAAAGRIDTLVLLGADPLTDFPDRDLARRALAGARTVVAVDLFLTESSSKADVVLAASGFGEVSGTTTNLEGRVSPVAQKVTPPGTARADWIIASDLASRLGADLGLESVADIAAEVERLSPVHEGLAAQAALAASASDGVLLGLPGLRAEPNGQRPALQGDALSAPDDAEPSVGEPEPSAGDDEAVAETAETAEEAEGTADADEAAPGATGPAKPPTVTLPEAAATAPPAISAYDMRLVTARKLYDGGTLVRTSASLSSLAGTTGLRLNPTDLERLGVEPGGALRISPAEAGRTTSFEATASPDPTVPRGSVLIGWGLEGLDPGELIDVTRSVTGVRVETVR